MSATKDAQEPVRLRFNLWHLFILTSVVAVFVWWTTIAGIENCKIRVEEYETFPDNAMHNEPYEATARIRVVSTECSRGFAEFIVIRAFIEPIEGFDDPSNFVGREFEFQYQKHNAFRRPSESLGNAVFKKIYTGRFQVNEETIQVQSIDTTQGSASKSSTIHT